MKVHRSFSRRRARLTALASAILMLLAVAPPAAASGTGPKPGSPAYAKRDAQNVQDGFGRIVGPGGQLRNPAYLPALILETGPGVTAETYIEQAARPTRPNFTPAMLPGWNSGNPLREGWHGRRGLTVPVSYTNRYGAFINGTVFAPLPGARDPYTGKKLHGPYPSVVITTGSLQGSARLYWWLAQDLAERGYVVFSYDVQGQGRSETLPHLGKKADFPYCKIFGRPMKGELTPCPGVPFQQTANFVYGTLDATDFFYSTPQSPWRNPHKGSARVSSYNPLWKLIDRSPDPQSVTPGRNGRLALIGHSLGAQAVSHVQGIDKRVQTIVALDKLGSEPPWPAKPTVPALALHAEYGAAPVPYFMNGCEGLNFICPPADPRKAPNPNREKKIGYNSWTGANVDSMLVVQRAATHLDYNDIPLVLPASRYGQDTASVYTQAWLAKYLKHDPAADAALVGSQFRYFEPVGNRKWAPLTLYRDKQLSFYFCSAYRFHTADGKLAENPDVTHAGC